MLLFLLCLLSDSGPTCERYTGSLCRTNGSIGMDYIYIDTRIATQSEYENDLTKVSTIYREEILSNIMLLDY